MALRPSINIRQYSAKLFAPGSRQAIPTIANGLYAESVIPELLSKIQVGKSSYLLQLLTPRSLVHEQISDEQISDEQISDEQISDEQISDEQWSQAVVTVVFA
jgi:hypothetical protein